MVEKEYLKETGIMIDQCPQCNGIWLDKGEVWKIEEVIVPKVRDDKDLLDDLPKSSNPTASHGLVFFQYMTRLPVEENMPTRSFPYLTFTLIGLNILIFLYFNRAFISRVEESVIISEGINNNYILFIYNSLIVIKF